MKNKKQAIILSVIASIALLVLIVGATYAYFQASGGTGTSANLRVTTYTTDVFNFEVGNDISIYADATSFASGKGNAAGSTFAKAILTANNKTNTATKHYYLYLNISNNTFTYTQNENTPELLLTITDASGNAVTDITSLAYKTVTDGKGTSISGYDITNKSGLITLFNNKEITASPTKTDEWNITVTLVNYDKDQSNNMGKSFNAKLMIQKEKIPTVLSDVCTSGNNLATCITTLSNKSEPSIVNIYHHTSSLANGAGDNSYRYAGASDQVNNFVCFGSTTSPCPTDNLYRIIGVFGENNHGVTGKQLVKLIKYDYATSNLLGTDGDYKGSVTSDSGFYEGSLTSIDTYSWNYKATNKSSDTWSTSLLNKINLNTNYLNNIGTTWSNLIEDATWKVSGHSTSTVTPSEMYTAEITNATKTYGPIDGTSKIGLVYASDYGFAASPSAWTTTLHKYGGNDVNGTSIKTINWMYIGHNDWTISPYSSYSNNVFLLFYLGRVDNGGAFNGYGSRPVLYLKSSVLYDGGSGTKDSPITLVV